MLNAFWIMLFVIPNAKGFTAYDCTIPNYEIKEISLKIKECDRNELKTNTSIEFIQITQKPNQFPVEVYQCLVNIFRTIYDCNSNSKIISSFSYLQNITPEECLKIQRSGEYEYAPNKILSNIKKNSTTKEFSVNLAGLLSEDGICQGTNYSFGMETWENVVVTADITISTRDFKAIVNSQVGEVEVRNGIYSNFDDSSYDDMEHGLTIWEAINYSGYNVIYEGEAEKAIVTSKDHQTIFYNIKVNELLFVISIIEKKITPIGWQTEYPNLIIDEIEARPTDVE